MWFGTSWLKADGANSQMREMVQADEFFTRSSVHGVQASGARAHTSTVRNPTGRILPATYGVTTLTYREHSLSCIQGFGFKPMSSSPRPLPRGVRVKGFHCKYPISDIPFGVSGFRQWILQQVLCSRKIRVER